MKSTPAIPLMWASTKPGTATPRPWPPDTPTAVTESPSIVTSPSMSVPSTSAALTPSRTHYLPGLDQHIIAGARALGQDAYQPARPHEDCRAVLAALAAHARDETPAAAADVLVLRNPAEGEAP